MRTIRLERVNFFIGSTALLEVYIDGGKCGELSTEAVWNNWWMKMNILYDFQ